MRRTSGTRLCVCRDENENRVLVNITQFQEFFIRTQCLRAQFVEGGGGWCEVDDDDSVKVMECIDPAMASIHIFW